MTAKQIKNWKIVDVVERREHSEIVICASPKATNVDLVDFARACVPSSALQLTWEVCRSGAILREPCGLTRGFRHYTLTTPRKETHR